MIMKSNITVLLLTLQINYMMNVKEINYFMDKLHIYFKSFLTLLVSVNSNLYLYIMYICVLSKLRLLFLLI